MNYTFSIVQDVIEDVAAGKMCILLDDEEREDEADLIICAASITPEHINFMAQKGRGLICLAMSDREVERINLPMMVAENTCPHGTSFTVSIDAKEGIGTGISAFDRARTIRLAASKESRHHDFRMPGHVFPLKAKKGGLSERDGHTEASVELVMLANGEESAVICEIMDNDGSMMRIPELFEFAQKHDLKILKIADLKYYLSVNGRKVA